MRNEIQQLHSHFELLASEGAQPDLIVDRAIAMWRDVDATLAPIIGQRGVAALLKRSVHQARTHHPSLAEVRLDAEQIGDLSSLRAKLAQQSSLNALAIHSTLLQTFVDLLASLIGESLTGRLLRSVWEKYSSGGVVREPKP